MTMLIKLSRESLLRYCLTAAIVTIIGLSYALIQARRELTREKRHSAYYIKTIHECNADLEKYEPEDK